MNDSALDPIREAPSSSDLAPTSNASAETAAAAKPNEALEKPAEAHGALASAADDAPEKPDALTAAVDKRRLEEQLEALKRKELELRRAIAIADHPELAEAIRLLEGRVFSLTRAEAKIAQGLSKSEERRRETLEKKLASLREKRAELDAQIAELGGELDGLVHARVQALESERDKALHALVATLGEHAAKLAAAGLDVSELVPEIGQRMPQIRAAAEQLVDLGRGDA